MKSPQLTERFEQALVYAHRLHAHQTRKVGNIPYIAHLLSVTALVLEAGGNEEPINIPLPKEDPINENVISCPTCTFDNEKYRVTCEV